MTKTLLPGCLSLFLICEINQKNRYCAYAGCLVALAEFWKLGPIKDFIWRAKPGCLVGIAYFWFLKVWKGRYRTYAGCLVALAYFWFLKEIRRMGIVHMLVAIQLTSICPPVALLHPVAIQLSTIIHPVLIQLTSSCHQVTLQLPPVALQLPSSCHPVAIQLTSSCHPVAFQLPSSC